MADKLENRISNIATAVWEKIDKKIADAPINGVTCCGEYSESLKNAQSAYVKGLRSARLSAIVEIDAMLAHRAALDTEAGG